MNTRRLHSIVDDAGDVVARWLTTEPAARGFATMRDLDRSGYRLIGPTGRTLANYTLEANR